MKDLNKYRNNPIGWWAVATEGDVEGKSTKHLGTYYGHIADIAFHLGNQQYYKLYFEKIERPPIGELLPPTTDVVNVQLSIKSGTWHMDCDERVTFVKDLIDNPDIQVEDSNYYGCVTLIRNPNKAGNKTVNIADLEKVIKKITG